MQYSCFKQQPTTSLFFSDSYIGFHSALLDFFPL